MIPKIIHLCWLSGDPFPEAIQKCLDSWKKYLPDYEVWLWNTERFDVSTSSWTRDSFANKKYAFTADYIRLYALYNFGGIYLDSDVLVYKSFDDLLDLPYFIGQQYEGDFEAAVIGAEKGTPWIKDLLNHYDKRNFILPDGSFDMLSAPKTFYNVLSPKYKFYRLKSFEKYVCEDGKIFIFSRDFFNSRDSVGVRKTKLSYCAHNYASSWVKEKKKSCKDKIKYYIPRFLLKCYFFVTHNTLKKKALTKYVPHFENGNPWFI